MGRKKGNKNSPITVPEDLKVLIVNAVKSAFPDFVVPITITKGYPYAVIPIDYQFNLEGIASKLQTPKLRIEREKIVEKIKAKLQENALVKDIEISSNLSFVNIFTIDSRKKECKACSMRIILGRQAIAFRPGGKKLCEWINDELLVRQMSELRITEEGL